MVKTLFEGEGCNLFVFKKGDEIIIEMIEQGVDMGNFQLGDNYNVISLNQSDAAYLTKLLLELQAGPNEKE